jgi:WD40 repeat protein
VATCSNDSTVNIWNITNPSKWFLISNYTKHNQEVFGLEWLTEDTLASGGYDKTIHIWSTISGETLRTISQNADVRSVKLLSNGFYLACGLRNNKITIHNVNNGSLISTLVGHTSYLNDLIQINEDLLASSSGDNNILIWNLTTNSTKFNLTGHTSDVFGLKLVSKDLLASGSLDKASRIWNITNGQLFNILTGHLGSIQWSIDFLSNSQTFVSGSLDKTIMIWNITTGELVNSFKTGITIRTLTILTSIRRSTSKNRIFSFYSKRTFLIIIFLNLIKL